MTNRSFLETVQSIFGPIINRYGYHVVETEVYPEIMGNSFVVLASDLARVMVSKDRSQVFVSFGLSGAAPPEWHDITYFMAVYAPGVGFQYVFSDPETGYPLSEEQQALRIASAMQTHLESVLGGDFSRLEEVKVKEDEYTKREFGRFRKDG